MVTKTVALHGHLGTGTLNDLFDGSNGTALDAHQADSGHRWQPHPVRFAAGGTVLTGNGTARHNGVGETIYLSTAAVPSSANYSVTATVGIKTFANGDQDFAGVVARCDPVADSWYRTICYIGGTGVTYIFDKLVSGAYTGLGSFDPSPAHAAGQTHTVTLDVNGSTIRMLVDGTERLSVTDSSLTAPGRAGTANGAHVLTATTGPHLTRVEAAFGAAATTGAVVKSTTRKDLAGTLTTAGALVKQPRKLLAGGFGTAAALFVSPGGVLGPTGALLKQPRKLLAGTLTAAGALTTFKQTGGPKLFSGTATLTTAGALKQRLGRALAGTLTTAGALIHQATRPFAGVLATAGALKKSTTLPRGGGLTPAGTLATNKTKLVSLSGTLTTAGALILKATRGASPAGTLPLAGTLAVSRFRAKVPQAPEAPLHAEEALTEFALTGETAGEFQPIGEQ